MTGEETKKRNEMNSGDLAWPVIGVLLSVIAILSLIVSLTGSSDAPADASSDVSTQNGSSKVDSSVWIKLAAASPAANGSNGPDLSEHVFSLHR